MTTATNINETKHVQYLEGFKEYLLTLAKSQNTIDSYLSDLRQYFGKYDEINRKNIQLFKKDIINLASTTFNRKMSSLKQFNEYLVTKGLVDEVFVIKKDYIPIQQQGNPTNISEKTVAKFLDRVAKKECMHKSRNIAIIFLMANTGIRREECCNLKLSYIDLKNGEMKFRGKGTRERKIILNKKSIEVIENYLVDRAKSKYADSEYLFISSKGEKLNKKSLNRIFDFYCTPTIKVSCHQLRHNYLSTMHEKGLLSLTEIQSQAGHGSITTSQRYLHPRMDNIKKKISDFSIG